MTSAPPDTPLIEDPSNPPALQTPPDVVAETPVDPPVAAMPSPPETGDKDCHLCSHQSRAEAGSASRPKKSSSKKNREGNSSSAEAGSASHPKKSSSKKKREGNSSSADNNERGNTPSGPGHRHTHSQDAKGHFLVYAPEDFDEEPKGPAGRLVKKMGYFAYVLFFLIPLTYVAIFFAIIPLGNPNDATISEQWVFLFISNVFVSLALCYLYNATFLSLARCETPFRTSLIPLAFCAVSQIAVMAPVLLTHGVYDWLGLVSLATQYLSLLGSMLIAYKDLRPLVLSFFLRFMLLIILFIPLLVGFVIVYRETDSSGLQSFIAFLFTFIIFVYRRIMLSRLDKFPLDVSQLLSGFWVQNLGDLTLILAFPIVRSPGVFAALFASNVASNVGFLIFVSDVWIYKIRPGLKTYVKEGVKFNFPIPPIPEADESFDPVNRGHDNNVGGYRRRQFRFFFFRMLSQAIAMFMYLSISPMLRFGLNKEFTPLSFISPNQYRNSMIYAACNLVFIALVALFGYVMLNKRHHQTFHEIREIHRHDLVHHTFVGLVTAIITHNLIFVIAIILSHYCVFTSFDNSCRAFAPR